LGRDRVRLFWYIFVIDFCLRLLFRATLRRFTRFNGMLPLCVPLGDPKGTEKVPATSDSVGGPAQGLLAPKNPKEVVSRSKS